MTQLNLASLVESFVFPLSPHPLAPMSFKAPPHLEQNAAYLPLSRVWRPPQPPPPPHLLQF
jgi:hypothetical protein